MEKLESTEDQLNILQCIASLQSGFQNYDVDLVMSFFEPSAIVCLEPGNPAQDLNLLRHAYLQIFKANPHYIFNSSQLLIHQNIASYVVEWTMILRPASGGEIIQSGLSNTVFEKQVDGKWLIIMDNPHLRLIETNGDQCLRHNS
jgi:ketosteroid isomerase-like protein